MQVNSIQNYGAVTTGKISVKPECKPTQPQVAFTANEDKNNNSAKAMRNLIYGLMLLGATCGGTSTLTSCDDGYAEAYAEANAEGSSSATAKDSSSCTTIDTLICHCHCHPDTIVKWYYAFQRPIPLDSLYNNMQNWDIDGTEGNKNDSTAKRNIIRYDGIREWEYNSKERGEMNILESSKNILVYDTEIKDYKDVHESYGKRVFRIPTGNFTLTKKNGEVLRNPKGLFVEEYENPFDEKGGSILDCKIKSRAFVTTNGDTLNVSILDDGNKFVETGKVAKGYLGANSILLRNLIGRHNTDDHYVDFNVEAINDEELRCKYVKEMDAQVSGK